MTLKMDADGLAAHVGAEVRVLIRRESFEARSGVVAEVLAKHCVVVHEAWDFRSADRPTEPHRSTAKNVVACELSSLSVGETVRQLRECAERLQDQPAASLVLVDITVFRREELLILLRMLKHYSRAGIRVALVYTSAASYSPRWLSRGVVECRSIVGFSGDHSATQPDHLILMLGFELDRAQALIDFYEPAKVSIGRGSDPGSISPEFYARNLEVFQAFLAYALPEYTEFVFTPEDPVATARKLEEVLEAAPGHNQIIAPLNTKLATLGAGMVGLKRSDVQLCYSVPAEYNEEDYSTPGGSFYVTYLSELVDPA